MALIHLRMFFLCIVFPILYGGVLRVQNRDWMGKLPAEFIEGDVECFSEYMELWIHRMRTEGLRLWLSAMLRIQVNLGSLEILNHQLSACGFGLHKDPDRNYIFRVMYSGCFVQQEHGHYVIVLNLMKRISRFGGRTHNYVMKCPVVPAPPNAKHIQCDPDFIQVTRVIPMDSWNNELRWSLALRGSVVVALEDASLIQVNVDIKKPLITVQGRRNTVLSPVQVLQTEGQFLPLKLVSGQYAYSMEATCPNVIPHSSEDTVLHVYKRRMGLTKRGGYDNETLSISSVYINQTDTFTWSETTSFVTLVIPTALIQKTKKCVEKDSENPLQSYFRVDIVLTFKETNYRMLWTMENTSPCSNHHIPSVTMTPSVTPKSPTAFTALKPTILNSLTEEPLLSSSMEPQTSPWTTEKRFSMTGMAFQPTRTHEVVAGFSVISGSADSESTSTSFKADASTEIPGSIVLTPSVSMGSDATLVSLSNPSFSPHHEQFTDLTNARKTSTVMLHKPPPSTTDNTERPNTNSEMSKAVRFDTSHSEAETKWSPVALSLYLESTSTDIITNTVSDITLNTPTVSLTAPHPHQRVTRPSLSPLHPDTTVHSAVLNKTTITHTTHDNTSLQPENVTLAST
ncbi:uncharacterized protein C1orf127 homolog isoform X2 [Tachysurus fulvidraco]|uniref:uncharacterized protein C1orf127 homolog isoform X2 n=1 Tax=Tachysurus fulvidraco TaxID=1234273 RepID=UPI001FEEACA8|nr:uncharacterized protein C1orf127 homolog isoform X2 [Tachysurus fulvidraco]